MNLEVLKHQRGFSGLFSVWKCILIYPLILSLNEILEYHQFKGSFKIHKYLNVYELLL